jgi:diguanylate cyclase (GGDEF)-like protein
MDQNTVIVMLSAHLIAIGALFFVIGLRMPPRQGLGPFALGAVLFGSAYALRLATGIWEANAVGGLLDSMMVLAVLLFIDGLRQFVGARALAQRRLVVLTLLFGAAHVVAFQGFGLVGRYALLNACLAVGYAVLAVVSLRASASQGPALRWPLRMAVVLMCPMALLTVLRVIELLRRGTVALSQGLPAQLFYGWASLVALLLGPCLLWLVFLRLNSQLAELASRDALTRVLNRNGLADAVARHWGGRDARPITVLQVDIDHFKRINDRHGHVAGDQVLRDVAHTLSTNVRAGDLVARVGGEEFLVACIGGSHDMAAVLAERLRGAVAALSIDAGAAAIACTVSIGVSRHCRNADEFGAAWRQADQALYEAKTSGRNRVQVAVG